MTDTPKALAVLRRNLKEAEEARVFHRARGLKGNVELSIASFTVSIIKRLIREIEEAK